jgi:hypothetical protein
MVPRTAISIPINPATLHPTKIAAFTAIAPGEDCANAVRSSISVVCGLGSNVIKQKRPILLVIMALAFLANMVWKVNVIYIILASALMGILLELMGRKRGEA